MANASAMATVRSVEPVSSTTISSHHASATSTSRNSDSLFFVRIVALSGTAVFVLARSVWVIERTAPGVVREAPDKKFAASSRGKKARAGVTVRP